MRCVKGKAWRKTIGVPVPSVWKERWEELERGRSMRGG
jgi:hypothetical protein